VANQILFYHLRAAYQEALPHARLALADHMLKIAGEEMDLAKRQICKNGTERCAYRTRSRCSMVNIMARSELIDTLADLIRIKSVNPAYDPAQSETEVQKFVMSFFETQGIEVWEQLVFPGRPNVIARLEGRNPSRRIVFEAHCDTAGVEGMVIPPFEPQIKNGRVYGRGACDTKAGLAAMMLAVSDLKKSGQRPRSEVWVVSAVDEEYAFQGVLKLRENLQAAAAVVSEPTEMNMATASKGCLRWRITVQGKAAHSSKPHLGANAIEHMARIVCLLEEHSAHLKHLKHPLLGSPTLNVGLIQGGTQVNIVPESCWIKVDRRLVPGEEPEKVLSDYRELLMGFRPSQPEIKVAVEPAALQDQPLETPADCAVVAHTARVLKEIGLDPRPCGVPFGSDASKLSRAGIPSIILGPGSIEQAHTVDEFVEIEQVEKAFAAYQRLMKVFE
jgi:acetylornithine deacetylase